MEARDDVYGLAPLAYAARLGREDTMSVKFLADRGADVSTITDDQWIALHFAAEQDQRLTKHFLVKAWKGSSALGIAGT